LQDAPADANVRPHAMPVTHMKIKRFLMFAAIHFATLVAAFTWSFSSTMDRFETGAPATSLDMVVDLITDTLSIPLGWLILHAPVRGD
jgi:hypothetical protein